MSNDKIHVRVFFNLSQYVCVLCMRGVAFTERGRPLADVINRAGKRSQTKGCKWTEWKTGNVFNQISALLISSCSLRQILIFRPLEEHIFHRICQSQFVNVRDSYGKKLFLCGMSSTVLHANQIDFLMHLILTILQLYNGVSDVGDCDYGSKYWAWSRDSFGGSKAWSHPCSSL